MKTVIRALLVALALGASGAYAASGTSHPEYDSQTAEGNSANWGVGG